MNVEYPIDIILTTHNNMTSTTRCMDALYKNTCIPFRVTVIDDSMDETPIYFARLAKEHGNINYVRPEEKILCGNQTVNIGLSLTKSDPVVSMTCTTFVEPEWLGTETKSGTSPFAIRLMEKDPFVGLIGFKIIDFDNHTIIEAGDHVSPNASAENIGRNDAGHRHSHVRQVNAIGWAAILIRRAAIPKGGWDETTYIGFRCADDIDNCLTVRAAGWKILYNGYGSVYHKLGNSEYAENIEVLKERNENYRRFKKKWRGKVPPATKE